MKIGLCRTLVKFQSTSDRLVPQGHSIIDGQPVYRIWDDLSIVTCLEDNVHEWLLEHNVHYDFEYDFNDGQGQRYVVDIQDHTQALLFKLTWGGSLV